MKKIEFYVPINSCEEVKEAMFEAGAGKIGNYEKCSWQTLGEGQFRANRGANPAIGEVGKLEKLKEYKVEMVCKDSVIKDVIKVLKNTHPYEEIAYSVYTIENY